MPVRILYRCPFGDCGEIFTRFSRLKFHVARSHSLVCPVCGEEVSSIVGHAYELRYSDVLHGVLYGLLIPCHILSVEDRAFSNFAEEFCRYHEGSHKCRVIGAFSLSMKEVIRYYGYL